MKSPKTEAEALAQSILIWVEIAQNGSFELEDKGKACDALLNYRPGNFCPLCEFCKDEENDNIYCIKCPVGEWSKIANNGFFIGNPCISTFDSPYLRWNYEEPNAAWAMVELLSSNLQRLAKCENHD